MAPFIALAIVPATRAARETAIKVHTFGDTLSELNGMETFDTLSDKVAENEVESKVEVNTKALDLPNG